MMHHPAVRGILEHHERAYLLAAEAAAAPDHARPSATGWRQCIHCALR